jgi:uncharacterized metal-binding protein
MSDCCKTETKLLYACSGAADVGEIADRVARKLCNEGVARMSCLASVGAGISGYVQSAKGADINITIDGCKTACAKKILESIGAVSTSYIITRYGLVKGETSVTEKVIDEVVDKIKNSEEMKASPLQIITGSCSCGDKC